jgi:hypothetical protein
MLPNRRRNAEAIMTPREALNRAFWTIKVPSMAVFFVPGLAYILLVPLGYIPRYGLEGFKWFFLVFVGGLSASWLIWSIQVPRWRLWAYRQVDDLDELKREAVMKQIIWPEGSFFEKTEIASQKVREEILRLQQTKR